MPKKGHKHKPESIELMRQAALKRPPITPEQRAVLSASHKGYVTSAKTKALLSAIGRGRKQTDGAREKLSIAGRSRSPYSFLGKEYPIHLAHLKGVIGRCKSGYCDTDLTPDEKGLQQFVKEIGPVPSELLANGVRRTVGRKDHSKGYVSGNYEWQSQSQNSKEMAERTWSKPGEYKRRSRIMKKAAPKLAAVRIGTKAGPQTKAKIAVAMQKIWDDPEQRAKRIKANKKGGKKRRGVAFSEEHLQNIHKANSTPEVKARRSEGAKKRWAAARAKATTAG